MPASRSARAMILAPRSCPSRPGFATTTRIFRLLSGEPGAGSVLCSIVGGMLVDSDGRASRQLAFGELLAQHLLVELAHARLRHLVDEGEFVRDPPFRDLPAQML